MFLGQEITTAKMAQVLPRQSRREVVLFSVEALQGQLLPTRIRVLDRGLICRNQCLEKEAELSQWVPGDLRPLPTEWCPQDLGLILLDLLTFVLREASPLEKEIGMMPPIRGTRLIFLLPIDTMWMIRRLRSESLNRSVLELPRDLPWTRMIRVFRALDSMVDLRTRWRASTLDRRSKLRRSSIHLVLRITTPSSTQERRKIRPSESALRNEVKWAKRLL